MPPPNDDLASAGKAWGDSLRALSEDALLDQIGVATNEPLATGAAAELQRRTTERLIESVDRFSRESSKQAASMWWLTLVIAVLTGVLLLQGFGCLPASAGG